MIAFILFCIIILNVIPIVCFIFFNWLLDWLVDNDYKNWVLNTFLILYILLMSAYLYLIVILMIGLM